MIKAIETKYKGYRFRSRLEARWAVFFETAGYEWVYEPEGFDLGNGDYYLPDFLVRSPNARRYSYVEIKPGQDFAPVRKGLPVYLAGAVSIPRLQPDVDEETRDEYWSVDLDDWRNQVSDSIPYRSGNSHFTRGEFGQYRFRKGYIYKGPHFFDDHGVEVDHYFEEDIMAINDSRIIFAWIDREECYGTVAEIAYAYAKGIRVHLGLSNKLKKLKEYDFVRRFAVKTMIGCRSVVDAWDRLMPGETVPMCSTERKAVKLSEALAAQEASKDEHNLKKYPVWVDLVFGDPVEHSRWRYEAGTCFKVAMNDEINAQTFTHAASASRSARFEHGENG